MKKIIDLTLLVETGMPTCGTAWHQNVSINSMGTIAEVGRNTCSILLGSHSGTHMDAPAHFIEEGNTIESLNLDILCGVAKVIDFRNKKKNSVLTKKDFENIELSERIILCFGWYKKWKTAEYYAEFPYMDLEVAEYLVEQGVKLIAMDTPSPDTCEAIGEKDDSLNHKLFLKNNVVIVEYLSNTDELQADKKYELIALPLKVAGADGCPARVIAREI